ncbi:MAG: hypothetical protein V3S42_05175 [Candidatus Neomarinimicrobiota bacterium]
MDSIDITPTKGFPHMYDFIGDKVTQGSPIVLVVLTFVIIIYYILFSYLGVSVTGAPQGAPASPSITFIEIVMWGLFIFLVLINGVQYFFQVDIKTSIRNLFSPVPEVDITVTTPQPPPVPEIMYEDQVFHIPNNIYTYNQAKALCKAYDARLATYEEIENAYKNGAEWCGFGWSADQMALYPTQMETWKKLQKRKGHQHDCGRPGINGGFVAYKKAPFGVNCYGHKPKITPEERKLMDTQQLIPMSPEERRFEKKVKNFRKELPEILVSPFNYDTWSQL